MTNLPKPRCPFSLHLAIGLATGIFLAARIECPALTVIGSALLASSALLALLNPSFPKPIVWVAVGLGLGAFRLAIGSSLFVPVDHIESHLPEWPQVTSAEVEGCIVRGSRATPSGSSAQLELRRWRQGNGQWQAVTGALRLWSQDRLGLVSGDCVRASGTFLVRAPPLHPFDGLAVNAARAPLAYPPLMIISRGTPLERRSPSSNPLLGAMGRIDRLRLDLELRLRQLGDGRGLAWTLALATGSTVDIDPTERELVTASGIAHILAVSGLHLALFVLSVRRLFMFVILRSRAMRRVFAPPIWAALIVLPLAWGFVVFTGLGTASIRAAVFLTVVSLGDLLGRPPSPIGALGGAAAVLLLVGPSDLFSASLQLSLVAVLGIMIAISTAQPLIYPKNQRRHRLVRATRETLRCAVAATLFTLPVTAYHFGQVSLTGIPANLVVAPVLAIIGIAGSGIALATSTVFPGLAEVAMKIVDVAVSASLEVCEPSTIILNDPQILGRPTAPEVIAFYAALLGASAAAYSLRLRVLGLRFVKVALAVVVCCGLVRTLPPSTVEIYFVPIGQGDAMIIRTPSGQTAIVDVGGTSAGRSPAARTLLPILRGMGVQSLDLLIITHGDNDHIGGLDAVLRNYPPRELWWTEQSEATVDNAVIQHIVSAGTVIRTQFPPTSREFRLGSMTIEVLHPVGASVGYHTGLSENDNSLTVRLSYAGNSVLLPGDLEAEGEALLSATDSELEAQVLKAPHHGSRTSSTPTFLSRVMPSTVIITAGTNNRYGFPHAEVVDRYRRFGFRVYRTDIDGLIVVRLAAHGLSTEAPFSREPQ